MDGKSVVNKFTCSFTDGSIMRAKKNYPFYSVGNSLDTI
jgi:hypothetical protein